MTCGASAIITVTKSGTTARVISKYRPSCTIIGCTTSEIVWRQLSLSWGVVPLMIKEESNTDDLVRARGGQRRETPGLIHDGELVVLTAGRTAGHFRHHQSDEGACGRTHAGHRARACAADQVTASLCVAHSERGGPGHLPRRAICWSFHKVTQDAAASAAQGCGSDPGGQ